MKGEEQGQKLNQTRLSLLSSPCSLWGTQGSYEEETIFSSSWQILGGSGPWMGLAQLPHLHLHVGVGKVVLGRQFAVIIDEMVQDGWTQDGLNDARERRLHGGRDGCGYPSSTR